MFGRKMVVHARKEEGEGIKVIHDKRKKFLYKPRVIMVCIV
jgi:hypothetical protein